MLKLSFENSKIWSNMGAIYEKSKNYKKEVECCKKAVKL
ncbi:MAG: tetratricopeptide repeat protein [Promethearchaeota archaeon]